MPTMLPTTWEAVYDDGTTVTEPSSYHDLDRTRLRAFTVYRHMDIEGRGRVSMPALTVQLQPGMRLIHRRRWFQRMGGGKFEVTLVGWQETRDGRNFQCLAYLFPDGRIEMHDRFRDDHVCYRPIEPFASEHEGNGDET